MKPDLPSLSLYVGNRNYSSWSLRPWLALRWAGLPFETIEIELAQDGYGRRSVAEVLAVSPTGTVPVLHVGSTPIWDSLAISEFAAEQTAEERRLWPSKSMVRSLARSVVAEMHTGFSALRRDLPMNIRRRCPVQPWAPETQRDIQRVEFLWSDLRSKHGDGGPWLFGERSIADAFFTPVATRFRTYSVPLSSEAARYRDQLLADADFLAWEAQCVPASWDCKGYSVIDGIYS